MQRGRTIAPFGMRSRNSQQHRHPRRPTANFGEVCEEKSQKAKGKRWTEPNMAMVGGGTALEAGGGSTEG